MIYFESIFTEYPSFSHQTSYVLFSLSLQKLGFSTYTYLTKQTAAKTRARVPTTAHTEIITADSTKGTKHRKSVRSKDLIKSKGFLLEEVLCFKCVDIKLYSLTTMSFLGFGTATGPNRPSAPVILGWEVDVLGWVVPGAAVVPRSVSTESLFWFCNFCLEVLSSLTSDWKEMDAVGKRQTVKECKLTIVAEKMYNEETW